MNLNKKDVLFRVLMVSLFGSSPCLQHTAFAEVDWNECLEKLSVNWGENCAECMDSKDTYNVYYKNICTEQIDVMVCVQEKLLNWRCQTSFGLASQDTIYAYACKGSGRYLYWVKESNGNPTFFPTLEEVNEKYAE